MSPTNKLQDCGREFSKVYKHQRREDGGGGMSIPDSRFVSSLPFFLIIFFSVAALSILPPISVAIEVKRSAI